MSSPTSAPRSISSSLVTIIGVGGMGKTRLALEAGRSHEARDGTWLVELGLVTSRDQVDAAVASSLGLGTFGPSRDAVLAWLAEREVLLVLDNCEHVLDAVATVADAITSSATDTTVLTTSREPIGARGERLFPIGALSLPGPGVDQAESVALFVDRAGVGPSCIADDMDAVEEICRRLDGIPLAIELAAARMRTMSARDIAGHLDDRFRLLTGGFRQAVARHQTLQAALDWSYRLLDAADQRLLAELAVFEGPFTVHDAVGITSGDPDEVDVLNRLSSLVDRSLVVHSHEPEPYRLLETIRAYGRLRLAADGASDVARARHARHFRDRSRALWPTAWTADGSVARRQIFVQAGEYCTAARWARDTGDLDLVAELVPAISDLTIDSEGWPRREPAPGGLGRRDGGSSGDLGAGGHLRGLGHGVQSGRPRPGGSPGPPGARSRPAVRARSHGRRLRPSPPG